MPCVGNQFDPAKLSKNSSMRGVGHLSSFIMRFILRLETENLGELSSLETIITENDHTETVRVAIPTSNILSGSVWTILLLSAGSLHFRWTTGVSSTSSNICFIGRFEVCLSEMLKRVGD